jgi:nitrate/TMAO reductase-like tetraheme cytochrome c subunit
MEISISEPQDLLRWGAIACAVASALVVLWYLVARPPLDLAAKIVLLFGIALFPIGTAFTGNIAGYEASKERSFCAGCHVMEPYLEGALDAEVRSLVAVHSQNEWFGEKSCYTCHADYQMFGTITTKLAGLKHLYEYYAHYRGMPMQAALDRIELYHPFTNDACVRCHSTLLPEWRAVRDHEGLGRELTEGGVSCVSQGCHGPAHALEREDAERRAEGTP